MQSFAKIIGIFESHEYNAPMDMLKLLGTPFGFQLEFNYMDQSLLNGIKSKLEYWSSTNLLQA